MQPAQKFAQLIVRRDGRVGSLGEKVLLELDMGQLQAGAVTGEAACIDPAPRSADAIAYTDSDVFVLSRKRFESLAVEHHKLGIDLVLSIARVLAVRLRYANSELRVLHLS